MNKMLRTLCCPVLWTLCCPVLANEDAYRASEQFRAAELFCLMYKYVVLMDRFEGHYGCEHFGIGRVINITVRPASRRLDRKLCRDLVKVPMDDTLQENGWHLRLFAPGGGSPLASCSF